MPIKKAERARYWEPGIGRFSSRDTIQGSQSDPVSFRHYLYCQDDPVDGSDPSGQDAGLTLAGQSTTQGVYQNSQALGAGTVASFGSAVRASLIFRLGAYTVLGATVVANVAMVTDAILKTQPQSLDFRPAPKLDRGDEPPTDVTVHRMGGKSIANLMLRPEEKAANPPGFSILIGGTPE